MSKAKKTETVTLAYSPAGFARAIDRSVGFIRLEISRKRLKVIRRGRAILITKRAADEYLEQTPTR
jgi:hypothetical protein